MHFKRTAFLFIFFLTLISNISRAQKPFFRNYGTNEGLPSSELYHVIQDSKGFIWVAGDQGVSRFDGKTFKNFDKQQGLPENTVFEIFEDPQNRIWFVSFPFQLSYYEDDIIKPYKYNGTLHRIAGHGLIPIKKSFRVDENENVYFSFLSGAKLYKISNQGILSIVIDLSYGDVSTSILQFDGQLLSAQAKKTDYSKIKVITLHDSVLVDFPEKKDKQYSFGNFTTALSNDGNVIIGINNNLIIIKNDETIKSYTFIDRIHWVSIDEEGFLWIGQDFIGASKYSVKEDKVTLIENVLSSEGVSSVLVDNDGGEWFTTLSSGLFYRASKGIQFLTTDDGLSDNNINSIEYFNQKLYLGTENGYVDILDGSKISGRIDLSSERKISCMKSYNDETLWIATDINLHAIGKSSKRKFYNNHNSIEASKGVTFAIKDLFPINRNVILLAQMKSLSILIDDKVLYDSYLDDSLQIRIETIEQETADSYLLGTINGLWRYKNNSFTYLGKNSRLLKHRITEIVYNKESHKYIIGTKGSGLIVFDDSPIKQFTVENGLSSNSVTSILSLGYEIWVGTNDGINIIDINDFNKKSVVKRTLKRENGLSSNEVTKMVEHDKKVYIASKRGLTIIDLDEYSPSKIQPPVYIQGVAINNSDSTVKNRYILKYNENLLRITYTGVNFRDAGNVIYKYRLVGLNSNWNTTYNNQVDFAFLPPGDYRFEVIAINSERNQSQQPAMVYVTIKPPFWKTWWFYIVITIIAIIAVTIITWDTIRRIRMKHAIQTDLVRYRQQALVNQMDPHFVFNTLNSIQSFIMRNDSFSSIQYLSKFSRLMRIILNGSQKQSVSLRDEETSLNLYMELESMRFKEKFKYSITFDDKIDPDNTFIPSFIVQPFIENAIWHGIINIKRQGEIRVTFSKKENYLVCEVIDNGVGRKAAALIKEQKAEGRTSVGLANVDNRLSLMSEIYNIPKKLEIFDLYDNNGIATGTKVEANLPIIIEKSVRTSEKT